MLLRILAVVTGLMLLGGTAHVTVLASGGYHNPHAVLVLAIAAGVGVGALCIGTAVMQGCLIIAILIGVTLICGEAYGLLQTGERIIAARDRAQTPAREAKAQRVVARDRLNLISRTADALKRSDRLDTALAAQAAADKAAADKAAITQAA